MAGLSTLVRRNVRLYFADRAGVFFSLLGAMIAIFLVLLFLKSTIVDSMVERFAGLASEDQASDVLDAWLVASACVIASGTTGLGALGQYVRDRESGTWKDFLASPLPRWTITLGYLLSASVVSALMTTLVYAGGTGFCLSAGVPLAAQDVLVGWGWLMLSCLSFTAVFGFAVSWLRTSNAFSGLSIIAGTLFGFLAETYANAGALPKSVSDVLNSLPFAQASALVREPYTAEALAALPEPLRQPTSESLGILLSVGDTRITVPLIVAVLAGVAVVGYVASWLTMSRRVCS